MTGKLVILALCTAIGTAAGYMIMRSYKRNAEYMSGVCDMIGELKRNIAFKKDSAAKILCSFETVSLPLKKNITEYVAFTEAKDGKLELSRGALSENSYRKVGELFGSLGRGDGASQIEGLEAYARTFDELKKTAETKSAKYGVLSVKLGFLFGLAVGVLFL